MHVILLAGKIWKAQVAFIFHTYKQSLGLDITVTASKELGLPKPSILQIHSRLYIGLYISPWLHGENLGTLLPGTCLDLYPRLYPKKFYGK